MFFLGLPFVFFVFHFNCVRIYAYRYDDLNEFQNTSNKLWLFQSFVLTNSLWFHVHIYIYICKYICICILKNQRNKNTTFSSTTLSLRYLIYDLQHTYYITVIDQQLYYAIMGKVLNRMSIISSIVGPQILINTTTFRNKL